MQFRHVHLLVVRAAVGEPSAYSGQAFIRVTGTPMSLRQHQAEPRRLKTGSGGVVTLQTRFHFGDSVHLVAGHRARPSAENVRMGCPKQISFLVRETVSSF